jgi:membrane fusion protein (multidrug efflux system)
LDGQWVVTDGLSSGDKLVVIGGSKVKPEQEVVVKPLENANGASATPTAKTPQQAAKTVADDTSEQDTATTTN